MFRIQNNSTPVVKIIKRSDRSNV